LTPEPFDFTTFAKYENYDELVVARDSSFSVRLRLPLDGRY
jgi:hypothetical protein